MQIIYPPTIHWEGGIVFQRPQQLMKAFAKKGYRAVFMEYGRYDGTVYFRDGVEVCDCRSLLPKAKETSILWVSHPPYYRFTETMQADLLVFDYIDEAAEEFAIWNNSDLKEAMEKADVITVVSQRLYDIVTEQFPTKHVILLPNAADYEHFCNAKKVAAPSDMMHISQPILGFIGSLTTWIDTELIQQLAKLRPDWSIVLIGNDYINVEGIFADYPNVYFLGRKLYNELPPYVGQFAIGLVPFQVRNMTHSSSPIKMYEYLAAGLPVISTPIKEAVDCPFVSIGATAEEWVKKIECILSTRLDEDELKTFALQESWETRIKQVEPILVKMAEEKKLTQGYGDQEIFRLHQFPVTSSHYWDIRFLTDWENLQGRGQTAFFADVIIKHLPDWLMNEINHNHYNVCDLGCGLGDALSHYDEAFSNSSITGIDFSREAIIKAKRNYPQYQFQIQNAIHLSNKYDVTILSNVLSLYHEPFLILKQLLKQINQYMILLVPFQNHTETIENQFCFEDEHFPEMIGKFALVFKKEIDCSQITHSYCQSKQMLAVYKNSSQK